MSEIEEQLKISLEVEVETIQFKINEMKKAGRSDMAMAPHIERKYFSLYMYLSLTLFRTIVKTKLDSVRANGIIVPKKTYGAKIETSQLGSYTAYGSSSKGGGTGNHHGQSPSAWSQGNSNPSQQINVKKTSNVGYFTDSFAPKSGNATLKDKGHANRKPTFPYIAY